MTHADFQKSVSYLFMRISAEFQLNKYRLVIYVLFVVLMILWLESHLFVVMRFLGPKEKWLLLEAKLFTNFLFMFLSLMIIIMLQIGETIADKSLGKALPTIRVEEPTVRMSFYVNTSPFVGREV